MPISNQFKSGLIQAFLPDLRRIAMMMTGYFIEKRTVRIREKVNMDAIKKIGNR